jgi:nucleoside-diphosphate-sugar epimerase
VRVLVTGGAGFIGSNLAERLVADGADVRVFDNLSTGFRENVPAGAELVEGDIRDETGQSCNRCRTRSPPTGPTPTAPCWC